MGDGEKESAIGIEVDIRTKFHVFVQQIFIEAALCARS